MTNNRQGNYRKDVQVLTNDPAHKEITFSVQANILETFTVTPGYVDFGQVPVGTQKNIEITLGNNGSEPIVIKELRINPAESLRVTPQSRLPLKPGEKKLLTLTLLAGKSPGIMDGSILIRTGSGHVPLDKTIYVRAEITALR